MSKKKKKPTVAPTRDLKPFLGLLISVTALLLFCSVLSFALVKAPHNWLGLLGHSLGWFSHALLGVGSYFFALFMGWFGWRLAFHKPVHHPALKAFFMALFLVSLSLLLNLLEFRFPSVA